MTVLKYLYPLLAVYLILASFVTLSRSQRWWVRAYDYPRVQVAVLSLAIAALVLMPSLQSTLNLVLAGLLIAGVIFQIVLIIPYTPLWRKQTKDAQKRVEEGVISVLISNVRMENREYHRLIRCIDENEPDIILLMEPDDAWAEALKPLNTRYPYSMLKPMPNHYGIMLFSRLQLRDSRLEFLREEFIPSVHTGIRLDNGTWITFHGLHPAPPAPGSNTDERDAEILQIGRWIAESDTPAIVAGDLNDVAWSHTSRLFRRLSGMSDPRVGRGFYNTYNALIPFFRYPLDHIFHTAHFRLVKLKRLKHIGSDHFPMLVVLSYEPALENIVDLPTADRIDEKEAVQKTDSYQNGQRSMTSDQ